MALSDGHMIRAMDEVAASGAEPAGRVVIGTVKGDLHDIGKNLVASILEGAGFEVTVTMRAMRTTIDAIRAAGKRDRVKVMVGGAPVTQQYADEIGADGYSENASAAVALARRLAVVAQGRA